MATEQPHEVTGSQLDLETLVRKVYGPKWNEQEVVYKFSNGREFKESPDANPYA